MIKSKSTMNPRCWTSGIHWKPFAPVPPSKNRPTMASATKAMSNIFQYLRWPKSSAISKLRYIMNLPEQTSTQIYPNSVLGIAGVCVPPVLYHHNTNSANSFSFCHINPSIDGRSSVFQSSPRAFHPQRRNPWALHGEMGSPPRRNALLQQLPSGVWWTNIAMENHHF